MLRFADSSTGKLKNSFPKDFHHLIHLDYQKNINTMVHFPNLKFRSGPAGILKLYTIKTQTGKENRSKENSFENNFFNLIQDKNDSPQYAILLQA